MELLSLVEVGRASRILKVKEKSCRERKVTKSTGNQPFKSGTTFDRVRL